MYCSIIDNLKTKIKTSTQKKILILKNLKTTQTYYPHREVEKKIPGHRSKKLII